MPIQVRCDKCGRRGEFPDNASGKTGRCKCGQSIPIQPEVQFNGFVIIERHSADQQSSPSQRSATSRRNRLRSRLQESRRRARSSAWQISGALIVVAVGVFAWSRFQKDDEAAAEKGMLGPAMSGGQAQNPAANFKPSQISTKTAPHVQKTETDVSEAAPDPATAEAANALKAALSTKGDLAERITPLESWVKRYPNNPVAPDVAKRVVHLKRLKVYSDTWFAAHERFKRMRYFRINGFEAAEDAIQQAGRFEKADNWRESKAAYSEANRLFNAGFKRYLQSDRELLLRCSFNAALTQVCELRASAYEKMVLNMENLTDPGVMKSEIDLLVGIKDLLISVADEITFEEGQMALVTTIDFIINGLRPLTSE